MSEEEKKTESTKESIGETPSFFSRVSADAWVVSLAIIIAGLFVVAALSPQGFSKKATDDAAKKDVAAAAAPAAPAAPAARGPGKRPAPAAAPAQAAAPDSAATENAIPDSLLRPGLQIPEPLRPWVPWVLHGKESLLCPFLHDQASDDENGSQTCVWPARLKLALRDKGGSFTQSFFVYKQQWVLLPGDGKAWPQEVRVDGQAAVVASPTHSDDGDRAMAATTDEINRKKSR